MTLTHKEAIILHGLIGNLPGGLLTDLYDELTTYLIHYNIRLHETAQLFENSEGYVVFEIDEEELNKLVNR